MTERLPLVRSVATIVALGVGSTMLGGACSTGEGLNPDIVSACEEIDADRFEPAHNTFGSTDIEAVVGGPNKEDDPEVLLEYAKENGNIEHIGERNTFLRLMTTDQINDLGEMICETKQADGTSKWYFTAGSIHVRTAYIAEQETEAKRKRDAESSPEQVRERMREQQATSTTTSTTLG